MGTAVDSLCSIMETFITMILEKSVVLFYMLNVWSTVKIRGTRVPQKTIVLVGRPRPYSIIILNMRFIPKA